MSLETLRAKPLSTPEVKYHYDELKPEFEKAKQKILKQREQQNANH